MSQKSSSWCQESKKPRYLKIGCTLPIFEKTYQNNGKGGRGLGFVNMAVFDGFVRLRLFCLLFLCAQPYEKSAPRVLRCFFCAAFVVGCVL